MPARYARFLLGSRRSVSANRQLGMVLALVAGAINAGGFLAVQQYTSHVTGMVSALADNLVLGNIVVVGSAFGAIMAFLLGAICCAILVNYARRHGMVSEYALPLLLEAGLILLFGLMGARFAGIAGVAGVAVPLTVVLLCFIMGLQNAVVTKISNAVIRTTHMTGIVTDVGIELGRMLYWNVGRDAPPVHGDREKLQTLCGLLACFLAGGIAGAAGFKYFGYAFCVPVAVLLAFLAGIPVFDDWRRKAA